MKYIIYVPAWGQSDCESYSTVDASSITGAIRKWCENNQRKEPSFAGSIDGETVMAKLKTPDALVDLHKKRGEAEPSAIKFTVSIRVPPPEFEIKEAKD